MKKQIQIEEEKLNYLIDLSALNCISCPYKDCKKKFILNMLVKDRLAECRVKIKEWATS